MGGGNWLIFVFDRFVIEYVSCIELFSNSSCFIVSDNNLLNMTNNQKKSCFILMYLTVGWVIIIFSEWILCDRMWSNDDVAEFKGVEIRNEIGDVLVWILELLVSDERFGKCI